MSEDSKPHVNLSLLKERLTIPKLWEILQLGPVPRSGQTVASPFRDDRNPSFSIFQNGTAFKDHATDEKGDVIEFYRLHAECSFQDAIYACAQFAGIEVEQDGYIPLQAPREPVSEKEEPPVQLAQSDVELCENAKREFLASATDDFVMDNHELNEFLERKKIRTKTLIKLATEDCLGFYMGKLLFRYECGIKIRWKYESSHSARWLCGKAKHCLWRAHKPIPMSVRSVVLTEGETDLMALLEERPEKPECKYLAIPAASWAPTKRLAYRIAACRHVLLAMDGDKAGRKAVERIVPALRPYAKSIYVMDLPEGKDLGLLRAVQPGYVTKNFDNMVRQI